MRANLLSFIVFAIASLISVSSVSATDTLYYLHQDHLGSTALVTDSSGNVVDQEVYYPYGSTRNQLLDTGYPLITRHYTGQVSDQVQTGLYYYNARYYSPTVAKFTQADTINDGLNRYSYVSNNPLTHTDPTGHCQNTRECIIERLRNKGIVPLTLQYLTPPLPTDSGILTLTSFILQTLNYDTIKDYQIFVINPEEPDPISQLLIWKGGYQDVFIASHPDQTINDVFRSYYINKDYQIEDCYFASVIHEIRHAWQSQNMSAVDANIQLAQQYGIQSEYYLEYDPGNLTSSLETLPIRPYSIINEAPYYHDIFQEYIYVSFPYYNTDQHKISEFDAVLAETISINPDFKYAYPYLYNRIISAGNFFNPKQFIPHFWKNSTAQTQYQ